MSTFALKSKKKLAALAFTLLLSGCAGNVNDQYNAGTISDPIEPFNRAMFKFNDVVDIVLIGPVAKGYRFIVPEPARESVRNFFKNLRSPLIVANQLLQGDIGGAGVATARFVLNTTIGIGGLIDVAEKQGLAYEKEDFGQTLAVWGMGDGFYIVWPIIGPSSLRDTAGLAVDTYADPLRIWAHNEDKDWIYITRNLTEGLANREVLIDTIEDMRKNSLDYYAAVRSIYVQHRQAEINDAADDGKTTQPYYGNAYDIPDYDDGGDQ